MTTNKEKVKKGYWRTEDGSDIKIKNMSDSHLLNSARLIERKIEANRQAAILTGYSLMGVLHGEMALDSVDRELMRLESAPADPFEDPKYEELYNEITKRGLLHAL